MFNYRENDELFVIPMSNEIVDQNEPQSKTGSHSDKVPEVVNRFFATKTKVKQ